MNSHVSEKTKFTVLVAVTILWLAKEATSSSTNHLPSFIFTAWISLADVLPIAASKSWFEAQLSNLATGQLLPKGLHHQEKSYSTRNWPTTQLLETHLSLAISLDDFPWTSEPRIHCRLPLQSSNIAAVAAEAIVCQCKRGHKTKRYSCHCCNHLPELNPSWRGWHLEEVLWSWITTHSETRIL